MKGWEDVTPEDAQKMAYSSKTAQKADSTIKKSQVGTYAYYVNKSREQEHKQRQTDFKPPAKRKSKYNACKTMLDGYLFDSKAECEYYAQLKVMQRGGVVTRFELQPEFLLQEGFTASNGERIRPIKYRADFFVYHKDGTQEVIDVKGMRTKEYLLKKKWFLHKYPEFKFTEVDAGKVKC